MEKREEESLAEGGTSNAVCMMTLHGGVPEGKCEPQRVLQFIQSTINEQSRPYAAATGGKMMHGWMDEKQTIRVSRRPRLFEW